MNPAYSIETFYSLVEKWNRSCDDTALEIEILVRYVNQRI